jgi:hypothetical protein
MDSFSQIKSKSDLIVRASDFVIEHKENDKFSQHYTLDS